MGTLCYRNYAKIMPILIFSKCGCKVKIRENCPYSSIHLHLKMPELCRVFRMHVCVQGGTEGVQNAVPGKVADGTDVAALCDKGHETFASSWTWSHEHETFASSDHPQPQNAGWFHVTLTGGGLCWQEVEYQQIQRAFKAATFSATGIKVCKSLKHLEKVLLHTF